MADTWVRTPIIKHSPGGKPHDQKSHGRKKGGRPDEQSPLLRDQSFQVHDDPIEEVEPQRVGRGTEDSPLLVTTVEDAVKALDQGLYIHLQQPDEVATLLDRLKEIVDDARAKGDKAPVYNLCLVSVPGTNLFCAESKNVPRNLMPQLGGKVADLEPDAKARQLPANEKGEIDISPQFLDMLAARGVEVTEKTVKASHLRATQKELDGGKVGGMADAVVAGRMKVKPIFVTRDGYVIDGHHRWAANVGALYETGNDVDMPVYEIDLDIIDALAIANNFAGSWGIPKRAVGKADCGCDEVAKHLSGGHDQKTHGTWARGQRMAAASPLSSEEKATARRKAQEYVDGLVHSADGEQVKVPCGRCGGSGIWSGNRGVCYSCGGSGGKWHETKKLVTSRAATERKRIRQEKEAANRPAQPSSNDRWQDYRSQSPEHERRAALLDPLVEIDNRIRETDNPQHIGPATEAKTTLGNPGVREDYQDEYVQRVLAIYREDYGYRPSASTAPVIPEGSPYTSVQPGRTNYVARITGGDPSAGRFQREFLDDAMTVRPMQRGEVIRGVTMDDLGKRPYVADVVLPGENGVYEIQTTHKDPHGNRTKKRHYYRVKDGAAELWDPEVWIPQWEAADSDAEFWNDLAKHQQGKHDQKTHGTWARGKVLSGDQGGGLDLDEEGEQMLVELTRPASVAIAATAIPLLGPAVGGAVTALGIGASAWLGRNRMAPGQRRRYVESESPLDYHTSATVHRIEIKVPDTPADTAVGADTEGNDVLYHDEGSAAWIDYSTGPYGTYIHYISTNKNVRGQGHARKLVERLYKATADNTTGEVDPFTGADHGTDVDWGEIWDEGAWHLYQEMERRYPDRYQRAKPRIRLGKHQAGRHDQKTHGTWARGRQGTHEHDIHTRRGATKVLNDAGVGAAFGGVNLEGWTRFSPEQQTGIVRGLVRMAEVAPEVAGDIGAIGPSAEDGAWTTLWSIGRGEFARREALQEALDVAADATAAGDSEWAKAHLRLLMANPEVSQPNFDLPIGLMIGVAEDASSDSMAAMFDDHWGAAGPVTDTADRYEYLVTHEFGHAVAYRANAVAAGMDYETFGGVLNDAVGDAGLVHVPDVVESLNESIRDTKDAVGTAHITANDIPDDLLGPAGVAVSKYSFSSPGEHFAEEWASYQMAGRRPDDWLVLAAETTEEEMATVTKALSWLGRTKCFQRTIWGESDEVAKHQQGKHDQKSHGRKKGGAKPATDKRGRAVEDDPEARIDVPHPTGKGRPNFAPGVEGRLPLSPTMRIAGGGGVTLLGLSPGSRQKARAKWNESVGLTPDEAINNLVETFSRADDSQVAHGEGWYAHTNVIAQEIASIAGVSMEQAAGMIAALSPQTDWALNAMQAKETAKNLAAGNGHGRTLEMSDVVAFNDSRWASYQVAQRDYANGKREKEPDKPDYLDADDWDGTETPEEKQARVKGQVVGKGVLDLLTNEATFQDGVKSLNAFLCGKRLQTDPDWAGERPGKQAVSVGANSDDSMAKAARIWMAKEAEAHQVVDQQLSGLKVRSFFNNIVSPSSERDGTMDSIMVSAMAGDYDLNSADKRYHTFSGVGAANRLFDTTEQRKEVLRGERDEVKRGKATKYGELGMGVAYVIGVDALRTATQRVNELRQQEGLPPLVMNQVQAVIWTVWREEKEAREKAGATAA